MPYVRVRDGERIFVRTLGRGPSCLLIHGFASDSTSWLPFVAPLAARYRFIMPDLRGFGLSRSVRIRYTCPLTNFAEDVEDVLAALGIEQLPAVGISMGAFTAVQSFRLFQGKRFSRYMHIDQGPVIRNSADYAHGLLGSKQEAFFARMAAVLKRIDAAHAAADTLSYAQLTPELRDELFAIFGTFSLAAFGRSQVRRTLRPVLNFQPVARRLMPEDALQTYLHIMRAYLEQDYDLREGFRAIQVPTTVLIGSASRMYPAEGQRTIASLVPHASIRELPGAGHVIPVEAPLRFVSELNTFLR